MYQLKHGLIREGRKCADWGTFISPDTSLETIKDPNEKLNVYIPSGRKAELHKFIGKDALFDEIATKIIAQRTEMNYEEQCSAEYYFHCFNIFKELKGKINRIAEVGTYLGGASCIFAGAGQAFNIELDLIEAKKEFLLYTYERIRRAFPEMVSKVRLFYGDLPSYVKNVVQHEQQDKICLHHDAAHNYNQVVNDLATLYFVKDKIQSVIIQDTNLRSAKVENFIFVDAAVMSVFGFNFKFSPLGVKFLMTTTPAYAGQTYFNANDPEGYYIPLDQNTFQYPHPSMTLESIDTVI